MKRTQSCLPPEMPETFDELHNMHPLRPIADAVDLENAGEVIDRLAVINNPTKDQTDYLGTLSLLYEEYESEHTAPLDDEPGPVEMLKYLMELQKLSQGDIAEVLGIGQSAVSMILSGERGITADNARKLAAHFSVDAGLFI